MKILGLGQIRKLLPQVDLTAEIEAGFVAYSRGAAVVPPVGELVMQDPPGDVHIKYGYLKGDRYYVIKIASGFHANAKLGLPSSNGMMLVFSQQTGEPVAVLLDEGYLTDIRTAVAGAIAARYLAPHDVKCIGIVGTGMQARLQLEYLMPVTACRRVLAWGRSDDALRSYLREVTSLGFEAAGTTNADEILERCNLVVTTTPSTVPILSGPVRPGTHITAMGSDTPAKQELDVAILGVADLVVADSVTQCLERGEIHHALQAGAIDAASIVELGSVIAGDAAGRRNDDQVTVADLTGVAVQDICISKAVFEASLATA